MPEGLLLGQSLHEVSEVLTRESPLEGPSRLLVVALEGQQSLLDLVEVCEVVGRQHLALDDGEENLDLVQPRGVDRAVDEAQPPVALLQVTPLQTFDGGLAPCDEPLSTIQ